MKLNSLLTIVTAFSISFSAAGLAADEDTPLGTQMKAMNRNLRTLKRQLADPAKKEDNLALLEKIKKSLDESHKLEPAKTKEIAAGERAAYTEKYKQQIIELGKSFGEVEAAIKVDKPDEAKKALEKISDLKEKGHKDFGVDEC